MLSHVLTEPQARAKGCVRRRHDKLGTEKLCRDSTTCAKALWQSVRFRILATTRAGPQTAREAEADPWPFPADTAPNDLNLPESLFGHTAPWRPRWPGRRPSSCPAPHQRAAAAPRLPGRSVQVLFLLARPLAAHRSSPPGSPASRSSAARCRSGMSRRCRRPCHSTTRIWRCG